MATQDTCITIHPYFKVSEGNLEAFKGLAQMAGTAGVSKSAVSREAVEAAEKSIDEVR